MAKVSIRNPGCVCQIRPARRVEASQAVEIVGATIRVGAKMQMMVRCSARIDTILRAEVQGPRFSLCAATEEFRNKRHRQGHRDAAEKELHLDFKGPRVGRRVSPRVDHEVSA